VVDLMTGFPLKDDVWPMLLRDNAHRVFEIGDDR
jgi:hypothetical protein